MKRFIQNSLVAVAAVAVVLPSAVVFARGGHPSAATSSTSRQSTTYNRRLPVYTAPTTPVAAANAAWTSGTSTSVATTVTSKIPLPVFTKPTTGSSTFKFPVTTIEKLPFPVVTGHGPVILPPVFKDPFPPKNPTNPTSPTNPSQPTKGKGSGSQSGSMSGGSSGGGDSGSSDGGSDSGSSSSGTSASSGTDAGSSSTDSATTTAATPQPATPAAAQPVDLQLVSVTMIDAGDAAKQLGPTYRVAVRNVGTVDIKDEFDVVLAASTSRDFSASSPYAGDMMKGLKAGETRTIDIQLPATVYSMGRNADGKPVKFSMVMAMADSQQKLAETTKDNLLVLNRADILVATDK